MSQPIYSLDHPYSLSQLQTALEGQKIYDQNIYDRLHMTVTPVPERV